MFTHRYSHLSCTYFAQWNKMIKMWYLTRLFGQNNDNETIRQNHLNTFNFKLKGS